MKLYLIRHGQTDWNIQGKIQGTRDVPLNKTGRAQAARLAQAMEAKPVKHIFSSPQLRAMETARQIGRKSQIKVCPLAALSEVGFGKWEGLTWGEIMENYPREYERWSVNPVLYPPPKGESKEQIHTRIRQGLQEILEITKGREDAVAVTHGTAMAGFLACVLKGNLEEFQDVVYENASITTLDYSLLTGEFKLVRANECAHLF